MRRGLVIALWACVVLAVFVAPAEGARLVTWKHTASRFVQAGSSPFNNVPAEAPAKPQALPVNVLLPDGYDPSRRYPVLYLMHGHGDSYWSWYAAKNGDLVHTAAGFPGIVVMPEGGQGWYTDWCNGGRRGAPGWESYHLRELIPLVEKRLPIRHGRRWHAIAGLSMGAEATMYYASQRPGYFGAAAAFSPPVSIQRTEWPAGFNTQGQDYATVFGPVDGFYATGHNPLALLGNLRWTRLFVGVGDGTPAAPADLTNAFGQVAERELHMQADEFVSAARAAGESVEYEVRPGVHDWPYWRAFLHDALGWGFFKPVRAAPRQWSFKTVARRSVAWGYTFRFASAAPGAVVTFTRTGGRLHASGGSGRVVVHGGRGCRFTARLPFSRPACKPGRSY